MTNPQLSVEPAKHITVDRAFAIATGTALEVDSEERQHMVDCAMCGDTVIRLASRQSHTGGRVCPIGSHIPDGRLRHLAESER